MVMNETIKDQEISSEQGNAKRRRLVRGAMALAPVVLTLRSGALAAASCTGAVVVSATFDDNGRILSSGVEKEMYCVPNPQICSYPDGHQKITGTPDTDPITPDKRCGNTTVRTNVAIVSSSSATSLRGV
jgi:hypothetical protein